MTINEKSKMLLGLYAACTMMGTNAVAQTEPNIPGLGGTKGADTFTTEGVISGSILPKEDCNFEGSSAYVDVDGQGECIRYFSAGLTAGSKHEKVIVIFHGDLLAARHSKEDYTTILEQRVLGRYDPSIIDSRYKIVQRVYRDTGIPAIYYARPGVFGSSGDHKARRQPREGLIVAHGIEWLKNKYKIDELHMTGQSGGGHIVATLLTYRDDIKCAVMTSGVVAVAARNKIRKWPADSTGFSTFDDPYAYASQLQVTKGQRIFIIGDTEDTNVPFESQHAYYKVLKKGGHDVKILKAKAGGRSHHSLGRHGQDFVGYCAQDMDFKTIMKNMKKVKFDR